MEDLFDRIGRGFRNYYERPEALILVLLCLGLLAAAAVLFHAFFSARARAARRTWRDFLRFAGAGGLTPEEAGLLERVARHVALGDPRLIFVRRTLFEGAVSDLGIDAARADSLRRKVYGP